MVQILELFLLCIIRENIIRLGFATDIAFSHSSIFLSILKLWYLKNIKLILILFQKFTVCISSLQANKKAVNGI